MIKLIKEYFQAGIKANQAVTIAQEAITLSFNKNNIYLESLLSLQRAENFKEKERVFDKFKELNKKKKKTEIEEKELLNLISYIDSLI